MFVHTFPWLHAIIITVKTPQYIISVSYTHLAENKIIIKNMRNYHGKYVEKIKKRDADEWWKN